MSTEATIALIVGICLIIGIVTFSFIRNNSSLELKVRKKHWKQLKKFISNWQSSFQRIDIDELINSAENRALFIYADFESNPLYEDIKNHIKDKDVTELWENVKSISVEIDKERLLLIDNVAKNAETALESFRLDERHFVDRIEICEGYVGMVYRSAMNMAQGNIEQILLSFQQKSYQGAQPGSTWCEFTANGYSICKIYCANLVSSQKSIDRLCNCASDIFKTTLKNMEKENASEYSYVKTASEIIKKGDGLRRNMTAMQEATQELLQLPLLLGDCKYIRVRR